MVHDLDTLRRLNTEAAKEQQRPLFRPEELAEIIERNMKFADVMSEYERGYNAAVTTVVEMLKGLGR